MLFTLLPLWRLHLLLFGWLHLFLLLNLLLLFLWLASEDPLQTGHSSLGPEYDAAFGEGSVGHCAGDGFADLTAFCFGLFLFFLDYWSFLIELHILDSHAETVVIPGVGRTDFLRFLRWRRPGGIGMELQRTLLLKVLNIRLILHRLLTEPIMRQFHRRLIHFLIIQRIINEPLMRILSCITVLVDEVDEMSAFRELLQEGVKRMVMGADEALNCVIFGVIKLSSG